VFKLDAKTGGATLQEYVSAGGAETLLQRLPLMENVANVAALMATDRAGTMPGAFVTCVSRVD
jgi:hypothetical protein